MSSSCTVSMDCQGSVVKRSGQADQTRAAAAHVSGFTLEESNRLPLRRSRRRSSGSVVSCRRAQTNLFSAQGIDMARIAMVAFNSSDRVRAVVHESEVDGYDSPFST